jgi:hypothetical protein
MPEVFNNPGVAIVASVMLAVMVGTVAEYWQRCRKDELLAALKQDELQLKRDMIQKGMSADEIERVLSAGTEPVGKKTWFGRLCRSK